MNIYSVAKQYSKKIAENIDTEDNENPYYLYKDNIGFFFNDVDSYTVGLQRGLWRDKNALPEFINLLKNLLKEYNVIRLSEPYDKEKAKEIFLKFLDILHKLREYMHNSPTPGVRWLDEIVNQADKYKSTLN